MNEPPQISKWVSALVEKFHPERVILFGSQAYGVPTENSDVDLLVIMRHHGRNSAKAIEILTANHPGFAVDLLVRTPEEIKQRIAGGDLFLRDIIQKGKVVYDAANTGVD